MEERVVSMRHLLLLHIMAMQLWKLEGIILAIQGNVMYLPSLECIICCLACSMLRPATQYIVSDCKEVRGQMNYVVEENSLSHLCIYMVDAKSRVVECSTRAVCIAV